MKIFIAEREIIEQIGNGRNAKGVKLGLFQRAHAFDHGYGTLTQWNHGR